MPSEFTKEDDSRVGIFQDKLILISMKFLRIVSLFVFTFSSHLLFSQNGDKANEKDIISSLNWKKWSPGVVPVFTPAESLLNSK